MTSPERIPQIPGGHAGPSTSYILSGGHAGPPLRDTTHQNPFTHRPSMRQPSMTSVNAPTERTSALSSQRKAQHRLRERPGQKLFERSEFFWPVTEGDAE